MMERSTTHTAHPMPAPARSGRPLLMKAAREIVACPIRWLCGFIAPCRPSDLPRQWRFRRRLRKTTSGLRLHLGCGNRRFEGFINIDAFPDARGADYIGDIAHLPCRDQSVQRIENYHVIEHLKPHDARRAVSHWYQLMAPGGELIIECPDLDRAARDYLNGHEEQLFNIYGRHRFPGDTHFWGYSAGRLRELVESAGFVNVRIRPARDYHARTDPCLRVECVKPGEHAGVTRFAAA